MIFFHDIQTSFLYNFFVSEKAGKVAGSETLAISAKAKELQKQGISVINLSVGEPDFDTPEYIKDAAIRAIRDGKTKYTDASGIIELREVISEKLKRENNLGYSPSQIIVSSGAKHSITNCLFALCNEVDEVLIPSPCWVSYPEIVKLASGIPKIIKTERNGGFKLSGDMLSSAVSKKTKGLILNSPSNPTGCVYREDELKSLAEIIEKNGLWVMSDEVYEKFGNYSAFSH
ncbi:TPA: hypothetical protein DCX16_01265 [bacterium]|nr:hypothetical protein [bacterium]